MRYYLAALLAVVCFSVAAQDYLPVDGSSRVRFKIKNFGATVEGSLSQLQGTIRFNADNLSAALFDVTVEASTINTGIKMRDNHLRKPDYFNTSAFKKIRFVSTAVTAANKPYEAIVKGNLTIKEITKQVSIPFKYEVIGETVHFTGEFKINRKEYGVGGSSITMADELNLVLDVTASK
ncbi:MAG: YceI family protein [Flammeovirgaceae bacterium]